MLCLTVVLCWAACVFAAPAPTDVVPLEKQQPTVIPIISQSEELEPNGTYKFSYETGNGIKREETSYNKVVPRAEGRSAGSNEGGESDSDEIHVQIGSYSYTAPDGTLISVRYIADENGFQPIGDHLPRVPSLPLSVSSSEKVGRALETADNAEAGTASVPKLESRSLASPEKAKPAEAKSTELPSDVTASETSTEVATTEVPKTSEAQTESSTETSSSTEAPTSTETSGSTYRPISTETPTSTETSGSTTEASTVAGSTDFLSSEASTTEAGKTEPSTTEQTKTDASVTEASSSTTAAA